MDWAEQGTGCGFFRVVSDGDHPIWVYLGEYRGAPRTRPFICYCEARYARDLQERTFRVYVTEAIRLNGQNKAITAKWHEIAWPGKVDERTGDEIALDLLARFNTEEE